MSWRDGWSIAKNVMLSASSGWSSSIVSNALNPRMAFLERSARSMRTTRWARRRRRMGPSSSATSSEAASASNAGASTEMGYERTHTSRSSHCTMRRS